MASLTASRLWAGTGELCARVGLFPHLGQPTAAPRIAPARGPPLWAAAGAEWVDPSLPWDPSAQPEPAYEFDQRIAW